MPDNELALLFDEIADKDGRGMKKLATKAAIRGLDADDGVMRAASARFLMAVKPELAIEYLPSRLTRETNKYVRSAMEAALRAAEIGYCTDCKGKKDQ
jgi:hypothetical protein